MFQNHRKQKSVLAIDRWSKYVGLAYKIVDQEVIFPVGYLFNDQMIFFHIADIIEKHNVGTIVVWRPTKQLDIQEKINKFINNMNYIIEHREIALDRVDEDYTSVQSGEIVSNSAKDTALGAGFKKNVAEDTVSAMLILERRAKKDKSVEA